MEGQRGLTADLPKYKEAWIDWGWQLFVDSRRDGFMFGDRALGNIEMRAIRTYCAWRDDWIEVRDWTEGFRDAIRTELGNDEEEEASEATTDATDRG